MCRGAGPHALLLGEPTPPSPPGKQANKVMTWLKRNCKVNVLPYGSKP